MTRLTIVIGISGFLQPYCVSNGVRALVREINDLYLPNVKANYYTRRVDPGELAAMIRSKASIDKETRIIFIVHSMGGRVAVEAIERYGAPVYALVCADAWNGLADDATLTIPANVERVWSFRQVQGRIIKGSEIVVAPGTTHESVLVEGVGHASMDEHEDFRRIVLQLAKGEP